MPGVTSDVTALPVTVTATPGVTSDVTALPVAVDLNQADVCSASVLAEHELGCD